MQETTGASRPPEDQRVGRRTEAQREPPHEDRTLTPHEVDLIETAIRGTVNKLLLRWLATTGLRISESVAVADKYVDLKRKVVRVRWTYERTGVVKEALKGSDHAYREVPSTAEVVKRLQAWQQERPA